jgi:hypothetical protein
MTKRIFKIENQFLFLVFLSASCMIMFKNSFWNFLIVPIGNNHSNFNDLVMVQQWSRFFDHYNNIEYIYTNVDLAKLNYPKIWILIAKIIENKFFFNSFLILNFSVYVSIFYYFIKKFKSYFFIYLFFSGPSLLALQRGNVETLIFILLFLIFFIKNFYLKKLIFFLSVILKIFPIFAIQYFLIFKKNLIKTTLLAITCLLYFYIIKDQLNYIFLNTPHTPDSTYGSESIILNLTKHYNLTFSYIYLSLFLIIFSFLSYFILFKKILINENYEHVDLFLIGSGIFIFTFLINSSHDYRLIFLFFCVPLILKLKIDYLKFTCLISTILLAELSRLTFFFGYWGGAINILFKIIMFYVISIIYLDLILKNYKIILKKNCNN